MLKAGIAREDLPAEMGCGSGMSCWRRLAAWQAAGVWARLHRLFLEKLADAGKIDWRRSLVDSSSLWAPKRGAKTEPSPTDRARAGSQAPCPERWAGACPWPWP